MIFLPNSVTVLILTTPICCGTIESLLVPSSPTRWHQLATFPLARRTIRLAACAHGTGSTSMPTFCCRPRMRLCLMRVKIPHVDERDPVVRLVAGTGAQRKRRMNVNFAQTRNVRLTTRRLMQPPPPHPHPRKNLDTVCVCVYTLTNRK